VPWTPEQKRARYAQLRAEVERLLGPRCAACGSGDEWAVDHEGGTRTYSARRMNSVARLRRYLEDARRGLVRRLCDSCNGVDGNKRRWYRETNIDDT
jgi:uncharacterized OB-fold protein